MKSVSLVLLLVVLEFCSFTPIHGESLPASRSYRFNLKSAGMDDGDLAEIRINGIDYSLNERGHNIVVVNLNNLQLEKRAFDTWESTAQVKAMITYLKQVSYGSVIAFAIRDSTQQRNMDYSDVAFMQSLGAGGVGCPVRVGWREAWAFVTQKVMPGVQFPTWKRCLHLHHNEGVANLATTIEPTNYQFSLKSAGMDDGNVAEIKVNGVEYSPNGRGHNVVVVNSRSLAIERRVFDTWESSAEVKAMINYLKQVPYGSVIAFAIRDSTKELNMDDSDVAFMRSLGAGGGHCPIRIGWREAWAFVTQKVSPGVPFPGWMRCSYRRYNTGAAILYTSMSFGG